MKIISLLLGVVVLSGVLIAFLFLQKTTEEDAKQKQAQVAKEVEMAYQEASKTREGAPEEPGPIFNDEKQDEPGADESGADAKKDNVVAFDGKVQVRIKEGRIQGTLDRSLIDRVLERHRAQIQHCYASNLSEKQPSAQGQIAIQFIINSTGSVTSVSVTSSTLKDEGVENCIRRAVRRWNFPSPEGGIVVASYTFEFSE